jgi:hypothetical protein
MQYKLTNSYSNVVYQKKRNMDKTIKFPAILLFDYLRHIRHKAHFIAVKIAYLLYEILGSMPICSVVKVKKISILCYSITKCV